ncbi:hypothetical protein OVA13_11750 [Pseudoxanthomonas sp. SL93]|uniref:hypothetical protein n=1 Tax=Pseudoxanthomonas sp. SL93 TaxID=2995142 RepID=UPI0022710836|nr:hypothetical protein [Pseudoxanthomonas sp. SL93]WAC62075.1 hypothetical protein OVA13_11750 [Pseudoxanthomonas sp. SL93]
MKTDNTRSKLHVYGAMSARGADRAGKTLANAVLVLASMIGISAVVWVARWW